MTYQEPGGRGSTGLRGVSRWTPSAFASGETTSPKLLAPLVKEEETRHDISSPRSETTLEKETRHDISSPRSEATLGEVVCS